MKQKYLNPTDRKRFLKHLDSQDNSPTIIALRTLVRTGCRSEELLMLSMECIDPTNNMVTILPAKGSDTRHIPLSRKMIAELASVLSTHEGFTQALTEGTRASAKRVIARAWKREVLAALGVGYGHTSLHSARSSFAVNVYLKMNNDVLLVQELLGHKALSSTEYYVKMSRSLEMAGRLKKVIG